MTTSIIKYELQRPIEHSQLNSIPTDIADIRFNYSTTSKMSNIEPNNAPNETIVTLDILSTMIIGDRKIDIAQSTAVYVVPDVLICFLGEAERYNLLATIQIDALRDVATFICEVNGIPYNQINIPTFETVLCECARYKGIDN
jgi:hypothetical protein